MSKFKLGLILDNNGLDKFNLKLFNHINQKNIDLHLLVNKKNISKLNFFFYLISTKGYFKLFSLVLFFIISNFEKMVIHFFLKKKFSLEFLYDEKLLNFSDIKKKKIYLNPIVKGNIFTYCQKDIDRIKKYNLDLIIRLNSGILDGEILKSSKLGVLSVHCGDISKYRGGPTGFWEVLNRETTTGFVIQKLNNKLDAGIIIYKGQIPTQLFYKLNSDLILKRSYYEFGKIILNIASKGFSYSKLNYNKHGKIYTYPKSINLFKYFYRTYSYLTKKFFTSIINKKTTWKINFTKGSINSLNIKLTEKNYNLGEFVADPFIFYHNNNFYIFAEKYDFFNHKGVINAYKIENGKMADLGTVLNEKFHLSFPYIFKFKNKIYMCPETYEKGEIRLYECMDFPMKWKFKKTLIKNVSAVDSMIFKNNKYWYLLTNIDSSASCDFSSELHCFYTKSKSPITANWLAHKNNPIIYDANKGRNGGLILSNNEYYRVSQNIKYDKYGEGFNLNKIIKITPNIYLEKQINFTNKQINNFRKTHHISLSKEFIAYDIKSS